MNTIELIERLYKEGSITFEEALNLGLQQNNKQREDASLSNEDEQSPDEYKEDLIIKAIYGDDEDAAAINIKECTNFMNQKNWELYNFATGEIEKPVSEKCVLENAKYVCNEAIDALVKKYQKYLAGELDQSALEHTIGTGAFRASTYIFDEDLDTDTPMLNLDLEFIPNTTVGCIDINKLIKK